MSHISEEINIEAFSRDGKHTMHFLLVQFIFSWVTLGIVPIVWYHRISNRIGSELFARNCNYKFGAKDFWLWEVLGVLILIGPFIYTHRLLKSMNIINADYLRNRK